MKSLLAGISVAAIMTAFSPAWGQTSPSAPSTQSDEQNAPGTGGTSKPGTPGLPGTKSGPAVNSPSSGTTVPSSSKDAPTSQDESKVPGLAGGKSGSGMNAAPSSDPAADKNDSISGDSKPR
jgi:hypothetical protein